MVKSDGIQRKSDEILIATSKIAKEKAWCDNSHNLSKDVQLSFNFAYFWEKTSLKFCHLSLPGNVKYYFQNFLNMLEDPSNFINTTL